MAASQGRVCSGNELCLVGCSLIERPGPVSQEAQPQGKASVDAQGVGVLKKLKKVGGPCRHSGLSGNRVRPGAEDSRRVLGLKSLW